MTTEEKFQAAVNIIRSLPKDGPYQPSHEMMVKFYGLYKQAVEGPCTQPKPAFYEVVKGYKWWAWSKLGSMTQDEAKNAYVDELKKIIETMAYTENVANFIDALGPFYEFIEVPGGKKKLNNNTKGLPSDDNDDDEAENDRRMNGDDGRMSESDRRVNTVPPVVNGVASHRVNLCDPPSFDSASEESSPRPSSQSPTQDMPVPLAQEIKEADIGANSSGDDEMVVVEVTSHQSGLVNHQVTVQHNNIYSDSDSDEEYSEPAESPEHLRQPGSGHAEVAFSSPSHTLTTHPIQISPLTESPLLTNAHTHTAVHLSEEAVCGGNDGDDGGEVACGDDDDGVVCDGGAVVCGGGDLSHPGGLQMTPRQSGQASRYMQHGRGGSLMLATPGRRIQGAGSSGGDGGDGGGGRRGSSSGGGGGAVREDVSAQLVMVLQRLQTDMESVLHRLNTLETLTLTQHHSVCRHCQGGGIVNGENSSNTERSWWPFPELSPRSTFFLLLWPIILLGGSKVLPLIRCRRKRS